MERAAATWTGEFWKTGTGGGPWDNIAFDPGLNRIYLGTSNAGPDDPEVRSPGGGDNLYTASIVALDADTGKYVWHYQINPRDSWDYDCTQRMTLATLMIDGKPRKVLMQAPKNGFFYVIDRETGDITLWPSPIGAHSWQDSSYSPRTGLVYMPVTQMGVHFYRGAADPAAMYTGGLNVANVKVNDSDRNYLLAWDPVHQKQAWRLPRDQIFNGGTLATAGDLVFQGTADGYLNAYDAASGARLWRFNAGLGIIAAPISYAIGGRQYVSVLVGFGASAAIGSATMAAGWKYSAPRRLLTFALDAKAALPAMAPPTMAVRALDVPNLKLDPAEVAAGHALYLNCALCHGTNLVAAGGPGPDLRESAVALDPDSLWSVVHDGALLRNGMPRFDMFTRAQLMQIYAYIRSGAREALAKQAASPPPR
jgi:quinohemoprotein ethanol dehydrogenase